MIEIQDLTVRYGEFTAVDGLTLRVEMGAKFGMLGPNGAGKTSTIDCIAGLRVPTAGLFTKVLMEQLTCGMTDPTVTNTMFGDLEQSLLAQSFLGVGGDLSAWLAFSRAESSLAEADLAVEIEKSKDDSGTKEEIGTFGTFSILAMSFAGGAMIPSFVMPEWILGVARALPTYWATEGLAAATWRGLPLVDSLLPAGILVAFSVFFAVIGIRRFRWE